MADGFTAETGRLAHAYIIAAPSGEESFRQAQVLAAAALCTGDGPKPCGNCRACRKVFAGVHPDVILLEREADDKGKRKKEIRVDQIRSLILDAQVVPNEADRKVYIVPEADTMNVQAQNAALKLLEEPPGDIIFVLCVQNEEMLLPTIRSRCARLSTNAGEQEAFDEETVKRVKSYLRAVADNSRLKLVKWSTEAESMDNAQAVRFAQCLKEQCTDLLCGRKTAGQLTDRQLMKLTELADLSMEYLNVNVGVKHLAGLLSVRAPIESRNRGNKS